LGASAWPVKQQLPLLGVVLEDDERARPKPRRGYGWPGRREPFGTATVLVVLSRAIPAALVVAALAVTAAPVAARGRQGAKRPAWCVLPC